MPFLSGGGVGAADFKATTAGGDVTAISNIAGDTWYNVWLVVDTTANLFDVYTSTGDADGALGVNDAVFRNGLGTGDLAAFGFSQRLGGRVQIDNLYMLPGVNTANPLAAGGGVLYAPETLTIAGDALLQPGASVAFNFATSGVNDLLSVDGLLTLAGTLEVVLDASAPPLAVGDSFDLLDFQSITGAFDVFDLPDLGANLRWDVAALTDTGAIRVALGLDGDFNNDGVVDAADYSVWRDHLGAVEDAAILSGNGAENGIVDAGDYELWRSNFGAVLASASTLAIQTPEPASAVLLVLMVGAGITRGVRRNVMTKSTV